MTTGEVVPALIVIDMQNDFVSGTLSVPGGATIIGNINSLISVPGFEARFASKEFHPPNHVSFANTHKKKVLSKIIIYHPSDNGKKHGVEQTLWPVHCVRDTTGAEFVPGLSTSSFNAVVEKGVTSEVVSYSAFKDIWGWDSTDLDAKLKEKGITDLYFVGLVTECCVKWSAVDAQNLGYTVRVVKDAVKSAEPGREALEDLESMGIKLTTTEKVKKLLS